MPRIRKSWDEPLKIGMTILETDGKRSRILEVGASGKTFLLSEWDTKEDWETRSLDWCHIEEAKQYGHILEGEEEEWEPKDGEKYWLFNSDGVGLSVWASISFDQKRKEGLGIYQTEELAKAAFERAKKAAKQV